MTGARLAGAVALVLGWAAPAGASCYDLPETRPLARYAPQAEQVQVTIAVDQSVEMPRDVQDQLLSAVERLARPGTLISIAGFSSYTGSRFPQIVTMVKFDYELPAALHDSVSRRGRDLLAICTAYLRKKGIEQLKAALRGRFAIARSSIGQSDILSSIQQFSAHIRASPARRKIFVIASDMYENSSAASFYRQHRPRMIDPAAELRNAVAHGLVGDLGGARVYVVGMALQPDSEAAVPAELVQRLERFWSGYFRSAGASGVWFGKPLLLEEIH